MKRNDILNMMYFYMLFIFIVIGWTMIYVGMKTFQKKQPSSLEKVWLVIDSCLIWTCKLYLLLTKKVTFYIFLNILNCKYGDSCNKPILLFKNIWPTDTKCHLIVTLAFEKYLYFITSKLKSFFFCKFHEHYNDNFEY